ncbi:MAG: phosphoglycerate kinase [Candidatus Sungbacteria bacterium RIFCSPLOWO2_01_FULL_47_10]|uniref:Phosphoglycerate kinase n=1 Tax=Candidatus Sungbacteria bacterium RIFCSPLOWO2_01_FULL_47_10 TaxID=1802276 RepID=A0A1G2L5J3_9BACT|nr:MAG: phosphoglycerate kinase [Candidatus Sungbacteria bacterium RIFCSPLOWO2_01_FULL_47_10]
MKLKTLHWAKLKKGMRVLVRADFNEPISHGRVMDDFRIRKTLPTIEYLLKKGCDIVLISHLGRPEGRKVKTMSLRPVARRLSKLLKQDVVFVGNPFGTDAFDGMIGRKKVFLTENIRFWPEEEKNDFYFAKKLAALGDFFVNDAFGASHRAHASVSGIPRHLPSSAGLLLEKEITALEKLLYRHRRPFFVLLGGAKASTKIDLVRKFLKEADGVLAGGAIGNTILDGLGFSIGKSVKYEIGRKKLMRLFNIASPKLFTLRDAIVAKKIDTRSSGRLKPIGSIAADEYIVDIGVETRKYFAAVLKPARTILWNGPLGVIEAEKFSWGTLEIVKEMKKIRAYKVTGGGETIAFLKRHDLLGAFDHVSTGGGAMLEFLAGKKLPGVEALKRK